MGPRYVRRSGRRLELLVGVLSFVLVLMVATLPLAFALIASVAFVSLLARAQERHAVALVSATVLLMTLLVELSLRAIPKDVGPQYFRPHEVLGGHEFDDGIVNYRPNERLEGFEIPYGGLANLSRLVTSVEPRVVDFYTDGLGFRNRRDYEGQAFVLFGVRTAHPPDRARVPRLQRGCLRRPCSRSQGLPGATTQPTRFAVSWLSQ